MANLAAGRLIVRVTELDISHGIRRDSLRCPIAQALGREGLTGADVGSTTVLIHGIRYNLSKTAQKFISTFDRGREVTPATFYLERVTSGK